MKRRPSPLGLHQLASTLLDAAAHLRAEAYHRAQGKEHLEQLASAIDTARLQLAESRPALARLYLATEKLRLHRPSTVRELALARKDARRALGLAGGGP